MSYIMQHASKLPSEAVRLDALHRALTEYCGTPLYPAELPGFTPHSILEVGAGSGAWSIEAAERYPDALVTAIDICPLPERPLPENLVFQLADVTKPFPFEPESFDLVHVRLILMHVPNAADVLRRAVELVRPGGWIIAEDPDMYEFMDENIGRLPPAADRFLRAMTDAMEAIGVDYGIGAKLEGILKSYPALDEVNVRKAVMPISGQSDNPALNRLGETWIAGARSAATAAISPAFRSSVSAETVEAWKAEMSEPGHSWATPFYLAWAHRRAD
ncbi:S-adenosyl-L-methionine-dependent methyltransferase [Phanerochaete sordida]|uniref:S-adenosyl-L-methionine-dependent methyltransferase n=1 Tax=Phanerochaete sordida TaxID=48140 RepID=A0A9P3G943_9APHY|nr:S-adenosyl-L-methionine-dependent methyltransferase [Phanerochaete sordida]